METLSSIRETLPSIRETLLSIREPLPSIRETLLSIREAEYPVGEQILCCVTSVDYTIDCITVKFSKPMLADNNDASYGPKGKEFFLEFIKEKAGVWTEKEWTVFVELKPDTEYSLSFPGRFFMTQDSYPISNTYVLEFKTGK